MDSHKLNCIVRQIEIAYRKEKGSDHATEGRLRQINPYVVRRIMKENKIGLQCKKCLNKGGGRYCCAKHSDYYRAITNDVYGNNHPFDFETLKEKGENATVLCSNCKIEKHWAEMSIDHIVPISKGGLEFDRANLQWMCLPCNLRKSNKMEDKKQKKLFE